MYAEGLDQNSEVTVDTSLETVATAYPNAALAEIEAHYRNPLEQKKLRYLTLGSTRGNYHDSEDLVQETYAKAVKAADTYAPHTNIGGWMWRIAQNTCIDQAKAVSRRRTDSGKTFDDALEASDVRQARENINADAMDLDLVSSLREAIRQKLGNTDSFDTVILCHVEGYSYEEICAITGAKMGTVKSRINRGLNILAKIISDPEIVPMLPVDYQQRVARTVA